MAWRRKLESDKASGLLSVVRPPRLPMGRAGRIFPLLPARTCVSPRPVPGVQNPFPRPEVSVSPFTDTECTWNCFFPEEKILFPNLGGWNLCLPSPRAPRADAAA